MTPGPVSDRQAMIAGMDPDLRPGTFIYAISEDPSLMAQSFAVVREDEGVTLVVPLELAKTAGLDCSQPFACITLNVHSALEGVGLTAAVSEALANQGIPANVIAGYHHDHILVPMDQAKRALQALRDRQAAARAR